MFERGKNERLLLLLFLLLFLLLLARQGLVFLDPVPTSVAYY